MVVLLLEEWRLLSNLVKKAIAVATRAAAAAALRQLALLEEALKQTMLLKQPTVIKHLAIVEVDSRQVVLLLHHRRPLQLQEAGEDQHFSANRCQDFN